MGPVPQSRWHPARTALSLRTPSGLPLALDAPPRLLLPRQAPRSCACPPSPGSRGAWRGPSSRSRDQQAVFPVPVVPGCGPYLSDDGACVCNTSRRPRTLSPRWGVRDGTRGPLRLGAPTGDVGDTGVVGRKSGHQHGATTCPARVETCAGGGGQGSGPPGAAAQNPAVPSGAGSSCPWVWLVASDADGSAQGSG